MKTTRFIIILIAVVFGGAPLHAQEERAGQGRPAVENPCEVTNAQLHQDLGEIIELQNGRSRSMKKFCEEEGYDY